MSLWIYKMPVKLWLDDIRDPNTYGYIGWVWVKTYKEAIELLSTEIVEIASLDHDLSIQQTMGFKDVEKTGYDVLCWMEQHNIWPKKGVFVHSLNPSGKERMKQVIEKYYKCQ